MLTRPTPAHDADAPPDSAPAQPGVERVSILCGERTCIACGFNLSGQPIVREPHYSMLIARCPECGAVVSLQEYPALGSWTKRWMALAAGLYILVLLGGVFAAGAIGYAYSESALEDPGYKFGQFLADRQRHDLEAQGAPPPIGRGNPTPFDIASPKWVAAQDTAALLAAGAPWRGVVLPGAIPLWAAQALSLFIAGVAGGATLIGLRGPRFLVAALIPVGIAAFFCWQAYLNWGAYGRYTLFDLSRQLLAPRVFAASLAVMYASFTAGLIFGRPITRALIKAFLPPRLRNSLSILWTADNLHPNAMRTKKR